MSEQPFCAATADDAIATRAPLPTTTKHLAYAEASVVLLESLIQLLVARRLLTAEEIVSSVEIAIATKQQMISDGEHPDISSIAAGVLSNIANSVAAMHVIGGNAG